MFHIELGGGAALRYTAEGIYCQVTYGQDRWLIVNAKLETSRAGRGIANPVPLGTIVQRCPGFPGVLKDLAGDGAFFAAARLS